MISDELFAASAWSIGDGDEVEMKQVSIVMITSANEEKIYRTEIEIIAM